MTLLVVSTSSPKVSVALLRDGSLIADKNEIAPRAASGTSIRLMQSLLSENGLTLKDVDLFVADIGPGSFTGVKVGVTLMKTLAFALGKKCAGVSAFDLISLGPCAIPARRGQLYLRTDKVEVVTDTDPRLEGATIEQPDAKNVMLVLSSLSPIEPEYLLPEYILEPSISQPKVPYKSQVPE
ncbi:MAG: tRNA (adenosine(37)-N6)-threonylcarbamoyltransferase complex dimerization subunit type 1 TsaB [Fimbriimonadales bacterium]|nr:tRNA (adenosine(37)-N6)-threonylcarbamoyltransferase complex dimerization subunit type 1 TsaB [Fimbriimonadales bacterium]